LRKAFTLVEMLVAVVLMTLLIGIAIFSFRMQLLTIAKVKTDSIEPVLKYNQIKSTLESIKYYVVQQYDMQHQPMKKLYYFFQGDKKNMLFITNNPIYSDHVALVKLSCVQNALFYKEEPLYGKMNYLQPSFTTNGYKTIKIYNNLQKCGFYYINNKQKLVRKLTGKIPAEIYLKLQRNKQDISIYSLVKEDDNLTAARIYNAIYQE